MTSIHHYSVYKVVSLVLKILSSAHSALAPPQATPDLVSIVFPFPQCHIAGILQYVAFTDWLLSLSNMHVFLGHGSSFFF